MTKPKVFISYSRADTSVAWVRRFADALERLEVNTWLDEANVQPGDNLRSAIERALRNCDVLISIITSDRLKRPNLFFELGAAVGMGKQIIAIVSKKVDLSDLPQSFRVRKFLVQDSPEKVAKSVQAALRDSDVGSHTGRG